MEPKDLIPNLKEFFSLPRSMSDIVAVSSQEQFDTWLMDGRLKATYEASEWGGPILYVLGR